MSTVKVKYVGVKPQKTDNVAGTGQVWNGPDDVQEVPIAAWAKLSKHPDIWQRVSDGDPNTLASGLAPVPVAQPVPQAPAAPKASPAAKTAATKPAPAPVAQPVPQAPKAD